MTDDFKYILQYIDNDTKVTIEFGAEISIEELADRLRGFLAASSWPDKLIRKIIKGI